MNQRSYILPVLLLLSLLASIFWLLASFSSEVSIEAVDAKTPQPVDVTDQRVTNQHSTSDSSQQSQTAATEQKHTNNLPPSVPHTEDTAQAAADSALAATQLEAVPLWQPKDVISDEGGYQIEAVPLWQPKDVISDEGGYQSEWVAAADVLAVVSISSNAVSNLKAGSLFSLPVGEKPKYRIEQKTQGVDGDVHLMAVYLSPKQGNNRYGVITEGTKLMLMTLYTDKGVYYLRSNDKNVTEVSFVGYSTLQQISLLKTQQQESQ